MIAKRLIAASVLLALTTVFGFGQATAQSSWPGQTQSTPKRGGERTIPAANGTLYLLEARPDARAVPQAVAPRNHQYRGGPKSFH